MLQITPQHKILIYPDSIDFRKGIDKIVVYDGTGFWLCHKRFSKGKKCTGLNHKSRLIVFVPQILM